MSNEFFLTMTLPKRYYRKKAANQIPIMRQALKLYAENFFDTCYGKMELTNKCNVHFHGIITYRKDQDEESAMHLKFLDACKSYSITDCQIVKDREKVMDYINKDVIQTMKVTQLNERGISYIYTRVTVLDTYNSVISQNRAFVNKCVSALDKICIDYDICQQEESS